MSLDVYLTLRGANKPASSGIFVRDGGSVREITREEWDEKFPGAEPVVADVDRDDVFSSNITHNLGKMADEAGIYKACWRPDENGITHAKQLIPILRDGLKKLKDSPQHFQKFNAPNGWGLYENFVPWVEKYLRACEEFPDAEVSVWR